MTTDIDDLLFDEPAELTKLYRYLVKHIDYKTRVTGIKRRVSYQSMKELLEVPATKGRSSVPSSRDKARAYIKRMVAIGLIVDQGNCVFLLPHESADKSDSRRFPRGNREVSTLPASNTNGSGDNFPRGNREVPTHLLSTTTTGFFQMHEDWEPSERFASDALRAGYDIKGEHQALFDAAMTDVRYAYMGKEELIMTKRNQIGWQAEVIRSMKYLLNQHRRDVKQLSEAPSVPKQGASTAKPSNRRSGVTQLIAKVPQSDGDLDRYYAQHKALGAPAAKHTADFTYKMWRADLTRWRNDKIREGIIENKEMREAL